MSSLKTLAIAALLAFGLTACQSNCSKLCERQAECSEKVSAVAAEKHRAGCQAVCRSLEDDAERRSSMQAAYACVDKSCDEFRACVKAVTTAP
jgi:hypothetical protein